MESLYSMQRPKRVLIVHPDPSLRRLLTVMLVEAGLQVRSVDPDGDLENAIRADGADLALLGQRNDPQESLGWADRLRAIDADLPIVLLLAELEFPLVVQGIRHGVTDVLPLGDDPKPAIRRILAMMDVLVEGEPTALDLAEVDATLAELDPLLREAAQDREAADVRARLASMFRDVQSERELMAAAQAGIDEKARMLAADRAELRREREAVAAESAHLKTERLELQGEQSLWAETLNGIRDKEVNLRAFEAQLRAAQSTLTNAPMGFGLSSATQMAEEWAALERAQATLAAERAIIRDEQMAMRDLDKKIRQREDRLREIEQEIAAKERVRRSLPPLPEGAPAGAVTARIETLPPAKPGVFRSLMQGARTVGYQGRI